MPLIFTNPLLDEITPELKQRVERAYAEFPEFSGRRVVVGITKKRWLDGYAVGGMRSLLKRNIGGSRKEAQWVVLIDNLDTIERRPKENSGLFFCTKLPLGAKI